MNYNFRIKRSHSKDKYRYQSNQSCIILEYSFLRLKRRITSVLTFYEQAMAKLYFIAQWNN